MPYGIIINDLDFSEPKYFFSHQISSSSFTQLSKRKHLAGIDLPYTKLKQCRIDDFLNTKIFVRKKSPFSKKASCVYSGTEAIETVVIGNDCCYIDNKDNEYFIVCCNPDDYEFLVYKRLSSLMEVAQSYGIEVYNQNGEATFNSNYHPCILSSVVNSHLLCSTDVIINTPTAGYPREYMEIANLLEINQNKVNVSNGYCELGISSSAHRSYSTESPNYPKQISCLYTIIVDITGELRYIPCFGIVIGQNDMIRGIRNFGVTQNVKLNRNCIHIGIIKK